MTAAGATAGAAAGTTGSIWGSLAPGLAPAPAPAAATPPDSWGAATEDIALPPLTPINYAPFAPFSPGANQGPLKGVPTWNGTGASHDPALAATYVSGCLQVGANQYVATQCQGTYASLESLFHTLIGSPTAWTAADETTLNDMCQDEGYAGTVGGACLNELVAVAGAYANGLPNNGVPATGTLSQCDKSLGPNFHALTNLFTTFACMRQNPLPAGVVPLPGPGPLCMPQIAATVKHLGFMDVRTVAQFPDSLPHPFLCLFSNAHSRLCLLNHA